MADRGLGIALTSPRMVASVEQGGGAARSDTSDLPAAAAVAEPDPSEHVASVSVGVVTADREAFDSDGVEHVASLDMDDAIHISAGLSGLTLCGQANRRNVAPFDRVWSDYSAGGQGCWTCLDERRRIEDARRARLSRWQEQR